MPGRRRNNNGWKSQLVEARSKLGFDHQDLDLGPSGCTKIRKVSKSESEEAELKEILPRYRKPSVEIPAKIPDDPQPESLIEETDEPKLCDLRGGNMGEGNYKNQSHELSEEELEALEQKAAVTAKYNKCATFAVLGVASAGLVALGAIIVKGLWKSDHSSLMRL